MSGDIESGEPSKGGVPALGGACAGPIHEIGGKRTRTRSAVSVAVFTAANCSEVSQSCVAKAA